MTQQHNMQDIDGLIAENAVKSAVIEKLSKQNEDLVAACKWVKKELEDVISKMGGK